MRYVNDADATIVERTADLTTEGGSPVKKSKRQIVKAKEAIYKFDKAWSKK